MMSPIDHYAHQGSKPGAIFLLPEESYRAVYGAEERAALAGFVNVVAPPISPAAWPSLRESFTGVEAIFTGWFSPRMDAALLAAFPALRIVFHAGGSVKSMLTDHFWERGLRLTCAARANAVPVAEFTFAQIVLGLKHTWPCVHATRSARRFVRDEAAMPSAYGSTVGILSLGLIGRLVADRLRSLDVRVIGYDPHVSSDEAARLGVELCELDEVFARADVVTCHTPVLPETTHLLRGHHFARMKRGATFINTARGVIVHEPEMIAVLVDRPDLTAVLDVTEPEPPAEDSLLYTLPNVVLTPHISGSLGPECRRMGRMMIDEARRYRAGQPLLGEVERAKLPLLA